MKSSALASITVLSCLILLLSFGVASASTGELYSGEATQGKGTKLTASLESETTSSLTDTAGNPIETCTESTLEGEITKPGSSTESASIAGKHLTFSGGPNCKVTVDQSKNGSLEVHHIAGTKNGTVTGSGFHVSIHVFGTTCVYGLGESKKDLGTLTGSTSGTATVDIDAIVFEQTAPKFLCPDSARWTAKYLVTGPDPLHVTAGSEPPPPEFPGELYSGEATQGKGTKLTASLESETTSSLTDTAGNPIETCTESTL